MQAGLITIQQLLNVFFRFFHQHFTATGGGENVVQLLGTDHFAQRALGGLFQGVVGLTYLE